MKGKLAVKILTFMIVCLMFLAMAPSVHAVTIEEQDSFVGTGTIPTVFQVPHPSSSGSISAVYETFVTTATTGLYFYSATVSVAALGDTGEYSVLIGCQIQGVEGEIGTTAKPNGTVYDTSPETFSEMEMSDPAGNITFTFGTDVAIVPSTWYTLVVYAISATWDSTNHSSIYGQTGGDAGLSGGYYSDSNWVHSGWDMRFYVYGAEPFGYGIGDLPPYVGDAGMQNLIDDFVSFIVPIIVILLPALLLIFFTRRTDKWLILIGLAIGAGLGYYFDMVPPWLVFLVAIGMIGLAYSEVRRNG